MVIGAVNVCGRSVQPTQTFHIAGIKVRTLRLCVEDRPNCGAGPRIPLFYVL
jgi:hypothetical protein